MTFIIRGLLFYSLALSDANTYLIQAHVRRRPEPVRHPMTGKIISTRPSEQAKRSLVIADEKIFHLLIMR